MRLNGTTKSSVASHLSESISGAMTIRAFGEEDSFFKKSLVLIDQNGKACFHSFVATEWLVQRLEVLGAILLSSWTLSMTLLHQGTSASGLFSLSMQSIRVSFGYLFGHYILNFAFLSDYLHLDYVNT